MSVNTKSVARRPIRFESIEDLEADLAKLEAAHDAGTLTHKGNLKPGQIMHHLARWAEKYETQDLPSVPLPLKLVGRMMRGRVLSKGFPAGLKGPDGKAQTEPDVSFDESLAFMRRKIETMRTGDFSHTNPFLGKLNHQQCIQVHLRHCELHLSFLDPGSR